MAPKITRDEDFWFPADLFTDELDYELDLPQPSAVSADHTSRADNSTIYSDELSGLDLDLLEIPQTIDVPKRKKAKTCEGGNEQFSSTARASPLLASWQPVEGQFSLQPTLPLAAPPTMVRAPSFAAAMSRPHSNVNTKSAQIKSLLVILCETIPSDPTTQVRDLMTLRMLLMRPQRTIEENALLDTILILFESYENAGRSRADIATMVVRDFSFHLQHSQQATYQAPAPSVSVSPVLQPACSFGFLPSGPGVSPRPSTSF